jgi:release factor glutamine methyltransferase
LNEPRFGQPLAGQTILAARRTLAAQLRAHAIESADLEARLLVGAVANLDLTGLMLASERLLTPDEATRLEEGAQRRSAGEPLARIIGSQEFWGLELKLSAATLVPRPDTETLIEAALDLVPTGREGAALKIADLGTGSGAILLALLSEWPGASGIATDLSLEALHTARDNAQRLGLSDRARFVACDYASALAPGFDLIVSNPPYIPASDIETLAVEVRDHDPRRALDGGADGLDGYRRIASQVAALLKPGGAVILEVGQGQSQQVAALLEAAGLTIGEPARCDLGGIPRAVIGRKP